LLNLVLLEYSFELEQEVYDSFLVNRAWKWYWSSSWSREFA